MNTLMSPKEVKNQFLLNGNARKCILEGRRDITNILSGNDNRIIIILGPPSIDEKESAIEYATQLKELADIIKDKVVIVMRANFQESNSSLTPEKISVAREILTSIANIGIPIATEFMNPLLYSYLNDCVSYAIINQKTIESPIHIELASRCDMPVGFNNPADGKLEKSISAMLLAKHSHTTIGINEEKEIEIISSSGSYHNNLILKGNNKGPNYEKEHVQKAISLLKEKELNKRLIIDCSNENASNQYENQSKVALNVTEQRKENPFISGIILDSFLISGKGKGYGQSRTDPCIDFQTTKATIERMYSLLE
jgi:3-deoxy-7-phosphoheptulonate synthase